MAKTPKIKKREVSIHSRAARRGEVSDGSGLAVKVQATETEYKPWLHSAQNAGVSKKTKVKQLSRQQKLRQQRALEKADVIVDKLERKVANSKARGKKIQARRKDWEDLSDKPAIKPVATLEGEVGGAALAVSAQAGQEEDAELPDLEQPLPIRTSEIAIEEAEQNTVDEPHVDIEEDEVT